MRKSGLKLSVILLSSLLLVLTTGCALKPVKDNQDKNIHTINNVLENTFTGPDKEFQDILDDVDDETLETEKEIRESFEPYAQYIKDLFTPYFTSEGYKEYVGIYGTTFLERAYRNDYELRIKLIDYEKTDSDETIYNFTFKIKYKKEESEQWETATVKGQANLDANHKIKRMLLRNLEFQNDLN